ncbi:MAG: ABC transporter substrate-binding protein [Roseomonas sp.]|jgi:phospholipid transport system substrate-binding protein|nr:ABC transporter substrate-binding protein [Roseomonas sp.]MCA3307493.1 ABC transporter substrate-binding protein [Roseomonas sp.]MCA3310064.1 ABC transporter substrate-binding protein [Roseomonas sp.]MCA3318523.1 ABC transporter substrate-binding protein [Roseomonas sp.]MCA3321795.1 ABC transporter substrate-binding protein [Roseomonas sp.]
MSRVLISRRFLLAGFAGLASLPVRAQQMDITRATAFVDRAGQDLVNAINDPRLNQTQRRDKVGGILRSAIDIEGTGRFILGRYVRQASPAELQDYLKLFDEIIIRNLSARFGEYRGVKFSLGRSQQRTEEDALVSTLIERPNNPSFTLDWRVADINGQPKVVDVIAEGTSLRLTTRSEYAAVIQRNSGRVASLLEAMRGQIAQLAAREGG